MLNGLDPEKKELFLKEVAKAYAECFEAIMNF